MTIQEKFQVTNNIYKITTDIDLNGGPLSIPSDCTLDFQGGSISNGTVTLRNTKILPNGFPITDYITATIEGTFVKGQFYFDESLGKPKWYDGSKWVDSAGVEV